MDAMMPVITDPKKLVRRQMKMIVGIATRPDDPYSKRAERLKALRFCTDEVKFQVLKASDRVSEDLYDGLYALYFGEALPNQVEDKPESSGVLQGPGWQEVKMKPARLTTEEIHRLIDLYNKGTKIKELGIMFRRTPAAISAMIYSYKHSERYKELFKLNEEKTTQTTEEKFEEIISSVDAGSKVRSEPKPEPAAAPDIPSPDELPKAFTATGRGFLSTDSGIKLDEEPITALLRQKIREKGLAQFYAEVEIIIRPVAPVGMVVNVEE